MTRIISKFVTVNEKIGFRDLILKYTLRDTFLGLLAFFPGSLGVFLRMIFLPFFLKKCGRGLTLREGVIFQFPERIELGNHVGISHFSVIDGTGGLKIGNFVRIGPQVAVITFDHNFDRTDTPIKLQGKNKKKIVIGDDVWIGAGVKVLAGVQVGRGAVLAAGAVVVDDVLPLSVVAGVPAKVIKKRN